MRKAVVAAVAALALIAAGCGGDEGISVEEHAQVLAELTLAQRAIADLQTQAGERAASEAEAQNEQWRRTIEAAIAEIGLIPDPGRDPVEQLSLLLVDLHESEDRRQAEMERAMEELDTELRRLEAEQPTEVVTTLAPSGSGGAGVVDSTTVSNHLILISLLAAIPGPDVQNLEQLVEIAENTGDPDLAAGLAELIDLAPTQSDDEYRSMRDNFLQRVANDLATKLEESAG